RSLAAVLTGWRSWWHLSEAVAESKRACPHDAVTGPLCESKTLRVGLQREWSGQEALSYPSKLEFFAVFGGDVARMERSVIRGSAVQPRGPPRISQRSIRATTLRRTCPNNQWPAKL